jgi:hypothetical protein
MYKLIAIEFTFLALLINSCNDIERVSNATHNEAKDSYLSSVIFLNGGDLQFKQYSRGCVNEEIQRMEVSKKVNNQIVISYFRNDIKILDKKVFDSSFQVYIKSFFHECDKLLKDTSSWQLEFGTFKTIQISDGLDIIEVGSSRPDYRSPFDDLVNAFCNNHKFR